MLVTEFPMLREIRPEQPSKVDIPILVTELGIVTIVNFVHDKNAVLLMLVIPFSIIISFWALILSKLR